MGADPRELLRGGEEAELVAARWGVGSGGPGAVSRRHEQPLTWPAAVCG